MSARSVEWFGWCVVLSLMGFRAWAQAGDSAPQPANDLDDQKAVMQAQIEVMRKELDLNSTLKSLALSSYQALPTVMSLSMKGGKAQVRLLLSSGASANFHVGDSVQGAMKISEITEREVFVQIKRNEKTLKVALEFATGLGPTPTPLPSLPTGAVGIIPPELMPSLPRVPVPSVRGQSAPNVEIKKP